MSFIDFAKSRQHMLINQHKVVCVGLYELGTQKSDGINWNDLSVELLRRCLIRSETDTKKRESPYHCSSHDSRPSHCPYCRNEQRRSPRVDMYITNNQPSAQCL